ncbi:methyl-accepting chemotaxis protein, partial [Burkholderia cenocepacia]
MSGKVERTSGLRGVVTVFCLFLVAIEALGFGALTSTRSGVDDLSDVAIAQVDAAARRRER